VKTVCDRLLSAVEASTPTLIVSARTADGQDVVAAHVLADGTPLVDSLDGKAIAMDPGPHVLRFAREGAAPIELHVVVREGEKNRLVAVTFPAPTDRPDGGEPGPSRPTPVVVYVLAGVGIVSLAAFGYLAIHGQSKYSECDPHGCSPGTVDGLTVDRYLAFAALGVGVATLGAAAYLWVTRPARAPQGLALALAPVPGGGGLWVKGAF
jgi:hypothetical protein